MREMLNETDSEVVKWRNQIRKYKDLSLPERQLVFQIVNTIQSYSNGDITQLYAQTTISILVHKLHSRPTILSTILINKFDCGILCALLYLLSLTCSTISSNIHKISYELVQSFPLSLSLIHKLRKKMIVNRLQLYTTLFENNRQLHIKTNQKYNKGIRMSAIQLNKTSLLPSFIDWFQLTDASILDKKNKYQIEYEFYRKRREHLYNIYESNDIECKEQWELCHDLLNIVELSVSDIVYDNDIINHGTDTNLDDSPTGIFLKMSSVMSDEIKLISDFKQIISDLIIDLHGWRGLVRFATNKQSFTDDALQTYTKLIRMDSDSTVLNIADIFVTTSLYNMRVTNTIFGPNELERKITSVLVDSTVMIGSVSVVTICMLFFIFIRIVYRIVTMYNAPVAEKELYN